MNEPEKFRNSAPLSRQKNLIFTLCLLVVLYVIFESLCFVGLSVLSYWKNISYEPIQLALSSKQKALLKDRLEGYKQTGSLKWHHPMLGWTTLKGYLSSDHMYVFNSQGIRAEREFSLSPQAHLLRIAAFGDSFTLGSDVPNQDTWEEQVSWLSENIEVLNFGVGGYGLDQAYLRYLHEGSAYHADIVIIGFMSENIFGTVNVFRPFYNNAYFGNLFTKPRYTLENGRLVLQENPLKTIDELQRLLDQDRKVLMELGRNDYHYQRSYCEGVFDFLPSVRLGKILVQHLRDKMTDRILTNDGFYNTQSETFKITDKVFDEFYRSSLMNDSLPIILIFPDRLDMKVFPQRGISRYQPLLDRFKSKGYRFIDLMEVFAEHNAELNWKDLTVESWGHYSPLGNKLVAEFLLKYLDTQGLKPPEPVHKKVTEERIRVGL